MKRVQVQGKPFAYVIPDGAVYVGRNNFGLPKSPFNNPHVAGKTCPGCRPRAIVHGTRERVVALYRLHLRDRPELVKLARRELAGKDLACFCPLDGGPCHADLLIRIVQGEAP
jgi:hypothetical protein